MAHVLVITSTPPVETPAERRHFSLMTIVGIAGGFGRICPSCADQVAERLGSSATPVGGYPRRWAGCDPRHVESVEASLRTAPASLFI